MFINIINSNSLTVDAADIHNWNEEYSSFYPEDLLETLKISISLSGIKKPIVLVKQNDKFYCVDGLRRLQIAQNLENENAWKHGDIPAVLDCSDNIDELYAACAFHKKELTTSQRAFFGAKWYYEETQALADWNRELRRHGCKIDQKIDTNKIVAKRVGISTPDYISKAHELLCIDSWFYDFAYKKGFKFSYSDVKQLVRYFSDKKLAENAKHIIQEMKTLADSSDAHDNNVSIYKQAFHNFLRHHGNDSDIAVDSVKNIDPDMNMNTDATHKSDRNSNNRQKSSGDNSWKNNTDIRFGETTHIGVTFPSNLHKTVIDSIINSLEHMHLTVDVIHNAQDLEDFQISFNNLKIDSDSIA